MVRKEKVISASVATGSMPGLHKLLHSKPAPSVHKKPYDDDDDRDMEAGFDDIMMEEKRRLCQGKILRIGGSESMLL
ncbi:uncharacterized protein LOC112502916 isoform X2 [Cynara cardunculus var. scolymus]|uniref:uncharacterized protein LOC112502916 isoform X2 n=1 Tax=Cynara cardunculus var. scolymus TaxID=59895 RepID=UPI000D62AD1A|nr:uncharacterized protein LOC112502916 isoform X2 [Cynara cardunculus var. scolymus]XP_024962700.1 uncharacterized protein LOC112502916 isoform X2 [Cynara cardunculus var. scolymus]XP_024962701.1 uncharacterized protein LOC112502916 isoform X2 [Cynara cardunculus var. scolymus]